MNIENKKISGRQFGRMIIYNYFAVPTLVLPGMLAKEVGMDGFFVLTVGCAAGYVLLYLVLLQIRQMRRDGQDFFSYLNEYFGKWITTVLLIVYLLTALFGAAYGLRLLCDIGRQYLIRDTPAWMVLAVIAVLAVYGLCAGLESRGRMYEIIFWFVLLPLLFLIFLSAYNVEPDRWLPVFQTDGLQVLRSSYVVFVFFAGSAFLPIFTESVRPHADVFHVVRQCFRFSVCVNLVLFLVLTGIFGAPTVATMDEAVLTLTAMVKVPGGFLERQDALLCGIWLVSVFAFVENALSYGVWCMKKISRKNESGWLLPGTGVFVYVLALCMYRSAHFTLQLSQIYVRIAVPILVGIVLVACILSWWKNRDHKESEHAQISRKNSMQRGKQMRAGRKQMRMVTGVIIVFAVFMTGCGQLEIEDRAFPLALAVSPAVQDHLYEFSFFFEEMDVEGSSLYHKEDAAVTASGYPQAFTLFGRTQPAGLDDSHMQVILLSEKLLRDQSFLESFYPYFLKEHHFSWNTMVYLLDDDSIKPEDLKESTGGRIGTYLRDMAQSDEQEKTAGVPTLGDLYMEWYNHEKVLLLPVLADDAPPSIDHYRLLIRGVSSETLTPDEARLLQFLRGDLKKMQLELSDGTIVSLEMIRSHRTYEKETDVWQVVIDMECKSENRVKQSAVEREEMMRESERVLQEQIKEVKQWTTVTDAHGQPVSPKYQIKLTWME